MYTCIFVDSTQMKTLEQAKAEFNKRDENVAQWARKNGFDPEHVRAVLYGRAKGKWGESHKIAIKLGLKNNEPS